jgi:hypothetical protein
MSSAGPFAAARLRVGCARTQGRGGEGEREGACFSRRRWVEENPLRPGPMKKTRLAFLLLRVDARSFSAARCVALSATVCIHLVLRRRKELKKKKEE